MERASEQSFGWADGPVGRRIDQLVVERFEGVAERTPDALAVTSLAQRVDGLDHHVSYGSLNRMAQRINHRLQSHGIGPESLVGVAVDSDLASIAAVLGVMKAGACFLPLDGGLPDLRLKRIIGESGLAAVLTPESRKARFASVCSSLIVIDDSLCVDDKTAPWACVDRHPQNSAYVIYTSGSTGEPKGVVVTQEGLANHCEGYLEITGLASGEAVLQFASLAFDFAYEEIFPTLAAGARLVLRTAEMRQDISALLRACQEQQVCVIDVPTAFWHLLTRMLESDGLSLPDTIRWVTIGGEEASAKQVEFWRKEFPGRLRLLNTYGPTEATIITTAQELIEGASSGLEGVPLGDCLPGASIAVLDQQGRRAEGRTGEIFIAGAGVARGYLGSPALTAERFLPDPDSASGGRSYRTGDLATVTDSGALIFKGRSDNQVKVSGHRVQVEEVEKALLKHPAIASCAVLLRDDRLGGKHLVAYCVLHRDEEALPFDVSPPSVMALRDFLRERIPQYMLPGEFSFLEKFILTANGKIDRSKLPEIGYFERKWRNLPEFQRPREGLETRLAEIWRDVLDLDFDEISAEDPFEYLGGNSLYSIQVRFKAQEAGLLFKASDLYLRQTIRGLAQRCQSQGGALRRSRHALVDYANYLSGLGKVVLSSLTRAMALGRKRQEKRSLRRVARFYEGLADKDSIVYIFFSTNLLHWLSTTLDLAPRDYNIVLIGSGLREDETDWVRSRFEQPFLHLEEEIDLDMIWDILFSVNRRNFGWLDVDCFVMNPSIFDEMKRISEDQAINCVWTHAACGPTKRPFHILESYFLFFNVEAIDRLRTSGLLPRPSASSANLRQIEMLKKLIPADEQDRDHFKTLGGGPFAHRLLNFEFARLILYQLVANASGYKLNRVRFFTEIDSFNPYNYYSDEAIHPFPSIRYYDTLDWSTLEQQKRLAADYLLMIWMLEKLPPSYGARKDFLDGILDQSGLNADMMRAGIRHYLSMRGVTDKTFARREFGWLAIGEAESGKFSTPPMPDRQALVAS